ncbi:hypothetical protein [Phaffia rhodozyma]|uniref:Uncharacterized protein n=1 Tax=Phaffia rhodozyma TaxID=264483 RepID=A0A0F7SVI1_PHARH|nr:hypothetical protein [Phaffia rhodozyma]
MTSPSSLPHDDPSLSSGQLFPPGFDPLNRRPSADAGYVSARSADALLSDIRPTSLGPQALMFLNELLDELLGTILRRSHGLSTERIKTLAVPYIIPLPLSRESISEAELELLSWTESEEGRAWQGTKEKVYASDDVDDVEQRWPLKEAWDLMRAITQTYSTFGDKQKNDRSIAAFIKAMESKGGDTREGIVEPAALYLTAIIEYIAEDVLASLSRVMVNDPMLSQASPKELYAALSHNEVLYEMMKRLKIKKTIENHLASKLRSAPATSRKHSQNIAVSGSTEVVQHGDPHSSSTAVIDLSSTSTQYDSVNSTSTRKSTEPAASSSTSKLFSKGSRPSVEYNGSTSSIVGIAGTSKASLGKKTGTYIRGVGEDAIPSNSSLRVSSGSANQDSTINEGEQQALAKQDHFDKLIQGENTKKMTLTPHALLRSSENNVDYRSSKSRSPVSRNGLQQNHPRSNSSNGKGPVSPELLTIASGKLLDRAEIDEEEVLETESGSRSAHGQLPSIQAKTNEKLTKSSSQTYPSSDLIGLFNQPSPVVLDSNFSQSRNVSSSRVTNISSSDVMDPVKGKKSGGLKSFVSKVMKNSSKETRDPTVNDCSSPMTVKPGPYSRTLKSDLKTSTEDISPEMGRGLSSSPSPVVVPNPTSSTREEPPSVLLTSRPTGQSPSAGQPSTNPVDTLRTEPVIGGQSLLVPNRSFRFDRVPAPSVLSDPPSPLSTSVALTRPEYISEPISPKNMMSMNGLSNSEIESDVDLGRVTGPQIGSISPEPALDQPSSHTANLAPSSAQAHAFQTSPTSIPLVEVAQLREILTHATTADECRLLVNALLGTWKVPHISVNPPSSGDEQASPREIKAHMANQVGKVYEWLLNGEKASNL